MPSIELRFEAYVVRATSPDAGDLAWLATVLECGFESVESPVEWASPTTPGAAVGDAHPTRTDSISAEVTLTIDARGYDALIESGPNDIGTDLEGFAQDSEPYFLTRWRDAADVLTLHDPHLPGFYRLSGSRRAVEILVRDHTASCRIALMRVVRELTMDHIVATGGVLIHGAAVLSPSLPRRGQGEVAGSVLVVSGPKRRGKTTLLLSLLEHTSVAYVSNDRCVLRVGDGSATVRGLPTIVSITRSGLATFPRLRERLFAARPDLAAGDGPSVGFGPHQLVRLLPSPRASCGPVTAFLFPQVTANPERLALRRLTATEAVERFRGGLFRATQATVLGDVFTSEARARAPWEVGEVADRWVAANLPCFQVELGGGEPPTADECRAMLARVLDAR